MVEKKNVWRVKNGIQNKNKFLLESIKQRDYNNKMKLLKKKKLREEYSKKLKFKTKNQTSKIKQSKIESLQFIQSKNAIKEDVSCQSLPKLNSNIDNSQNKIIEKLENNLQKESIIQQESIQEKSQDEDKISNRQTKIKFNNNNNNNNNNNSIQIVNKVTNPKFDNNKTTFNIFNQNQTSVETLKQNSKINQLELSKKNEFEKKKEQQRLFREELDRQIQERKKFKQNSVSKKKNLTKIPKIAFQNSNNIDNKNDNNNNLQDILETPKCREIGLKIENKNILETPQNHNIDSQKITLDAINKIHSNISNY